MSIFAKSGFCFSFDVVIPKEKQNPDLANILIKNELPGIFNWVLRGTNELRRRRFKFPPTEGSRKAVLRTLLGANPILAWLKAYSIRNEKNDSHEFPVYISAQDMYESFVMFCKDNEVEERDPHSSEVWQDYVGQVFLL